MNKENEERVLRLHKKSIIIDGLVWATPTIRRLEYFDAATAVGEAAANVTVFTSIDTPLQAIKRLKAWYDLFEKHGDKFMLVTTGRDIEKAKGEGKFGVIMGSQNADILGGDLGLLSVYKRLGLRIMQLSYFRQNLLGEGFDERTNSGLSTFGIEVVGEMNRLGLVIDVSHCGDQVTMDAIKYSKDPVLVTHANARGLVNLPRNKSDEQIKALAQKGGVIGVNSWSGVCEVRKGVRPTFEDLLDMIDYIMKLVGPDHVGLGLDTTPFKSQEDFDEKAQWFALMRRGGYGWKERNLFVNPNEEWQDDMTALPEITKGLVVRGYSDQDIEKIIGLNFLRVFKEVCG